MAAESGRHVVSAPVLFAGGPSIGRLRFSPALARVNTMDPYTDTRLHPFSVTSGQFFIKGLYDSVSSSRYLMA